MRLKSKLKLWVDSGLIDGNQSESIVNFERQNLQDKFHNGMKYVAYLALVMGIGLVIASNWFVLGIYFKLGAHVFVNAVLAGLIWYWRDNQERRGWRDGLVYLLSGLTLTLLGLISQSFHLQGSIGELIALWIFLITGFIIILGQNDKIATLWAVGFGAAVFLNIDNISNLFPDLPMPRVILVTSCATLLPLFLYDFGRVKELQNFNPCFANKLKSLSVMAIIVMAGLSSLVFYGSRDLTLLKVTLVQFNVSLALVALLFFGLWALLNRSSHKKTGIEILGISGLFIFLSLFIRVESDILAATHFILFALCLGYIAMRGDNEILLTLCLFAISIRLFIIFVELFGSMFATGWGLIIAGVLLLFVLKYTNRVRKKLLGRLHAS